ncbi:pirin-like C-terminal cupin domain-containing protein, partial [Brachybacterium sp. ACRRE]|uniref:pirin-like C-terminal cupin domain-containing protein n=1 Tax=Brachybacterium sp. ACRRE TaxID=2918184 RepID=UPI002715084C
GARGVDRDRAGAGGDAAVDLAADHLAHVPDGADALTIEAGPEPARLILIGGPPFAEEIVMWWNFVGRTHEEIAAFRSQWQHEIGRGDGDAAGPTATPSDDDRRFGPFPEGTPAALPAPTLPHARIRPRRRPHTSADPHEGDPR